MEITSRQLTHRQEAFVAAYLGEANCNGTEAARIAGYAHPNVAAHHDLLVNPSIKAHIGEALKGRGMGVEEVVSRLSDVARGSVEDVLDICEDGTARVNLRKAKERGKLHTIEYVRQTRFGPEVRLYSSLDALEKLAKVHKLFGDETGSRPMPELTESEAVERAAAIMAKAVRRLQADHARVDGRLNAEFNPD